MFDWTGESTGSISLNGLRCDEVVGKLMEGAERDEVSTCLNVSAIERDLAIDDAMIVMFRD